MVDRERALVHAEIVLVDPPMACTDDANPHAYLIAVERARLPSGPFAIQLGEDDPPAGVPEERTVVDPTFPDPELWRGRGRCMAIRPCLSRSSSSPGHSSSPTSSTPYQLYVHCGIEWLGRFNEVAWRVHVPVVLDFIPPEWEAAVDASQSIEVSIVLRVDPEPVIEATANEHTVTYLPTRDEPPGCR